MENKILAIVDGVKITERDVQESIDRFPADRRAYIDNPQGREQMLQQLIAFELMYKSGIKEGLENTDEYKTQLERMKKELLTQIAITHALNKVNVSDEDAKSFYDAHEDNFKEQEQVRAKHILVDSAEKADEVAEKIKGGLSFEDAAKEYSSCPSKEAGGDLGFFGRGMMVPEFENAAFELEIGKVSEPVKTQFGYHLIKVEEKKEAAVKPFEEVKDTIKHNLTQEKQAATFAEIVEELKKEYKVETYK